MTWYFERMSVTWLHLNGIQIQGLNWKKKCQVSILMWTQKFRDQIEKNYEIQWLNVILSLIYTQFTFFKIKGRSKDCLEIEFETDVNYKVEYKCFATLLVTKLHRFWSFKFFIIKDIKIKCIFFFLNYKNMVKLEQQIWLTWFKPKSHLEQ